MYVFRLIFRDNLTVRQPLQLHFIRSPACRICACSRARDGRSQVGHDRLLGVPAAAPARDGIRAATGLWMHCKCNGCRTVRFNEVILSKIQRFGEEKSNHLANIWPTFGRLQSKLATFDKIWSTFCWLKAQRYLTISHHLSGLENGVCSSRLAPMWACFPHG